MDRNSKFQVKIETYDNHHEFDSSISEEYQFSSIIQVSQENSLCVKFDYILIYFTFIAHKKSEIKLLYH